MNIGERIKAARKAAGMTQIELGELIGCSGAAVQRYEYNQREPRFEQLQKIATALNVPIEYFISDSQEETAPDIGITTGARIESIAKEKGVNLKQLAIYANIPYTTLYSAVKRNKGINFELLQKISSAFEIPIEYFADTPQEETNKLNTFPPAGYAKPDFHLSPGEERLLSAFNQLNISGKVKALERIEKMAELKRYQKNG